MKTSKAHYIQLRPHADLPDLKHLEPFMAIAVIDDDSDEMWRWDVARWLVASGCRFLLAWGKECESWRDAIDDAADETIDGDEAAPEQAVMGTSHEDEDLEEVFWFARHRANHPALQFTDTVILHVAAIGRGEELLEQFADA